MPELTISVTDDQAAILLEPFADAPACEAWLRERLVAYALEQEQRRMAAEALAAQREALAAMREALT